MLYMESISNSVGDYLSEGLSLNYHLVVLILQTVEKALFGQVEVISINHYKAQRL